MAEGLHYFMKTLPPILPIPYPFFKFCQPAPFHFLVTYNSHFSVLFVALLLWLLNGWSHHIWYTALLNDNMDLMMLRLGTIVPERPWCVLYARGLTHDLVFDWYPDLMSHTRARACTHTHTHCTHGPIEWHTHINIYFHHLLKFNHKYTNFVSKKISSS